MSNIKKIDGKFINLHNVTNIEIDTKYFSISFYLNVYDSEGWQPKVNGNNYNSLEQAEARIMEILKKQNSEEVEI